MMYPDDDPRGGATADRTKGRHRNLPRQIVAIQLASVALVTIVTIAVVAGLLSPPAPAATAVRTLDPTASALLGGLLRNLTSEVAAAGADDAPTPAATIATRELPPLGEEGGAANRSLLSAATAATTVPPLHFGVGLPFAPVATPTPATSATPRRPTVAFPYDSRGAPRLHVTNADLGVVHVVIPALLFASNATPDRHDAPTAGAGNLHLWLKHMLVEQEPPQQAQQQADGGGSGTPRVLATFVRGALFFESAADPINRQAESDHHLRVPFALYHALADARHTPLVMTPGAGAAGGAAAGGAAAPLHVVWTRAHDRPWAVVGTLAPPPRQYTLSVRGWPRSASVRPVYSTYAPGGEPPGVYFVIAPYAGIDADVQAQLLLHHIAYHARLGFAGWLAYVRGSYVPALAAHPGLAPHIAAGRLLLLAWEGVLHFQPGLWFHPDQGLVYNHALVALSGRNAYAALADIDEYLSLPRPAASPSLADALARCLPPDWGIARVPRHNVYCSACDKERPELEAWLGGGAGAGGAAAVAHPLQRYDVRGPSMSLSHCKAIVRPDRVYGWFVHEGELFPDAGGSEQQRVTADEGCLAWLHIEDQLWRRPRDAAGDARDTSWHWVFAPQHWGARPS